MTDAPLAVDARGVTKWFGETTALDRVDLVVRPGSVHGLVGANGAGKTTMLSVLFGLTLPDEGVVTVLGRTRAEAGRDWLDGVGGFVEAPRFYPYLSGRRNLEVLAGLDRGDSEALVDDVLHLVGLDGAQNRKAKGYSLGMRQRLGLAAAIVRRPDLLILDEPTNGMDPAGMRDLRTAVRRLADDGLTVLLSSHDMNQVDELCDAITLLDHGSVVFADTVDELRRTAPDPLWRLSTSDDPRAEQLAAEAWGIELTCLPGSGFELVASQDRLDSYVVALGRAGVAVRRLDQAMTPLESLMDSLVARPVSAPAGDETDESSGLAQQVRTLS